MITLPLEKILQKGHRFTMTDVLHIQIPIKGAGLFNGVVILFFSLKVTLFFLFLFPYLFSTS